jgi:hypothetical protein
LQGLIISRASRNENLTIDGGRKNKPVVIVGMLADQINPTRRSGD